VKHLVTLSTDRISMMRHTIAKHASRLMYAFDVYNDDASDIILKTLWDRLRAPGR
jgi:hypothetical protein